MTERKKPPKTLDKRFGEALARFVQTDPGEVAEAVAGAIQQQRKNAEQRIEKVRKELEDGARPRNGRFRL